MARRIDKDHLDKSHDYGIHVPSASLWLEDDVDLEMATRLSRNLLILEKGGATEVTIHLNTGGGDVQQALGIYDRIRSSRCHVTIVGYGQVASSGCLILQAADRRVVYKNTLVMWHAGTTEIPEMNPEEAESYAKHDKWLEQQTEKIMLEALKIPRGKYRRMVSKGMYLNAEQALRMGLVDEIL